MNFPCAAAYRRNTVRHSAYRADPEGAFRESEDRMPTTPAAAPLIVCDLDGTLLRPDATASDYTRAALGRLIAAGTALTIATARGVPSIRALLAGVELPLPVIELNGAYISDPGTGAHLDHHTLDAATASAVVDCLVAAGIEPTLTTWDGTADHVDFGALSNESARWFHDEKAAAGDPRLRYCTDFAALARTSTVALIRLAVPHDDAERTAKLLDGVCGDRATVLGIRNDYIPGWTEFSVHGPTADKGSALRGLRARIGHTGPLVVCGDHLNDLPMFDAADGPDDRRVAPATAHPDVLARATDVAGPNHEDGIARFLLASFLGSGEDLAS
ncbi:HAD-IIB family hydrolase [Yinghuangia soli]|uniref:Cof-type HAD-IIB family hydrolase n=1 Tax=Yinghuangia soli TaxID=2908204 RepID=A0AA41Q1Z1_9ACTN|nr:HAD-IIB family hydrolase [Yinghuangia soli]MCF2530080.1 Cof-type HAD-IIB family hydrolase [Yinghuangia soli]